MLNSTLTQYVIALLATGVINGSLGVFVFLKGFNKRLNQLLALYSISLFLWSIFEAIGIISHDKQLALLLWRINHVGVIFIPVFLTHFVFLFLDIRGRKRKLIPISYAIACIFVILDATPLLISEVIPKFSFNYFINPGPLYYLFFGLWVGWAVYAIVELFKEYYKTTGHRKNQMQYFCWSLLFSYIGGAPNFLPTFNIEIPFLMPFGTYAIPLYAFVTAYAMVRYSFMDIRVALTRAGIFVIVYLFVLGIPFILGYKYGLWHIATWVTVFLATSGPFILMFLTRQAEAKLLEQDRKRYGTLKKFTRTLGLGREREDLESLLKLIVYRVVKTLEISYGGLYLYDKGSKACFLKASHSFKGIKPLIIEIPEDSDLIKFMHKHRGSFLLEDLQKLVREQSLKSKKENPNNQNDKNDSNHRVDYVKALESMRQIKASFVMPSFLENEFIGFLVLSEKNSAKPYSQEDTEELTTLSRAATSAIITAIALIDLKKSQQELSEAARRIYIGQLASATGHQLGNNLNIIINACYGALDNDSILNCLKDNPQAKKEFEKIIGDIITNAQDGDAIIEEIRAYSRTQKDKKFTSVNLREVLDKTLKMLYIQVGKFQNIDIVMNINEDVPDVLGSFIGLQNVFVNMFNNGYDAIIEKKAYLEQYPELHPEEYKGKIELNMSCSRGNIDIHIIDNGKGMTPEASKKLFTPYYTSKASSDKRRERKLTGGTGIGLYIISRTIADHDGKIELFKTEPLKGTDFLIQLPIPKGA